MAEIIIQNLGQKHIAGVTADKSMLQHLQQAGIDWMHACGGKGRCTTCSFVVVRGLENMQPLSPAEEKYRTTGQLLENERLACQAKTDADVTIRVPAAYQLPHLTYSDETV